MSPLFDSLDLDEDQPLHLLDLDIQTGAAELAAPDLSDLLGSVFAAPPLPEAEELLPSEELTDNDPAEDIDLGDLEDPTALHSATDDLPTADADTTPAADDLLDAGDAEAAVSDLGELELDSFGGVDYPETTGSDEFDGGAGADDVWL